MILYVFSIQLMVAGKDPRAFPLYFGTYGMVYLSLGILYLLGAGARRNMLSEGEYRNGLRRGVRGILISLAMLGAVAGLLVLHSASDRIGIVIAVAFGLAVLLLKIAERAFPLLQSIKKN